MSVIRYYITPFLAVLLLAACNNNTDKKAVSADSLNVKKDSAHHISDSLVYKDCYEGFFKNGQQITDSGKIVLTLRNGNTLSLKQFFSNDSASGSGDIMYDKFARCAIKSIDNDTIPELIIYNYTGGAHCCDEVYVFGKEKKGFVFKAKLYGGFVCIDSVSNVFTYSFNEAFGYFYTCYGCSFPDSGRGYKTLREIELQYLKGKFVVKRYSDSTEKQLFRNLDILKAHGYEDIQDGMTDSGWRREFAMNFAVWHYNNGKNWDATRKLFDKYYTFRDAAKMWKEFYSTLKDSEKQNSI